MLYVKFYNHDTFSVTGEIPLAAAFIAIKITKKDERKNFPRIDKIFGDAKNAFLIKEDSCVYILVVHRSEKLKLNQEFCCDRDDADFNIQEYRSPRALFITSVSFANWRAERKDVKDWLSSFAGYCYYKFYQWVDHGSASWKAYAQIVQRRHVSTLGLFSVRDIKGAEILCHMKVGSRRP